MTVIRLYTILFEKIEEILSEEHAYRKRNLGWLMAGIYASRSVHLSKVANKLPGKAMRESRIRRFMRFLDNGAVRVREWYRPIAVSLLEAAAKRGEINLIIDTTKVASNYQLLLVSLAFRGRSLPIAWTWVRSRKGHSSGSKQLALLNYVRTLIPAGVKVTLVGDSEFTPLQGTLAKWGWGYGLRQKGSHLFRESANAPWRPLNSLLSKPGQCLWLTDIQLTEKHGHRCNLLAYWKPGETDPWFIATNFSSPCECKRYYRKRMWVDEMFGDFKQNGFDLERSRLKHFLRLSRLTLAVALLYVWIVAFGSATIKNGRRKEVDRSHRRDLSIFRIGFDMLERCLINNWPIYIRSVPYFT